MFRKLLLFFLIIISINVSYSISVVSSCQDINETILDADRLVELDSDLINLNQTCFTISADNLKFDCKNNMITGNGSNLNSHAGIYATGFNLTLQNCEIGEYIRGVDIDSYSFVINMTFRNNICDGSMFCRSLDIYRHNFIDNITFYNNTGKGIYSDYNNTIKNVFAYDHKNDYIISASNGWDNMSSINIYDSTYGVSLGHSSLIKDFNINNVSNYGIYVFLRDNNLITNGTIKNSGYGLRLYQDANYNNISNVVLENNNYGISISSRDIFGNRIFNNSFIENIFYDIYIWTTASPYPQNNYFYGNYFSGLIYSDDWAESSPNYFNYSWMGNYYSDYNSSNCGSIQVQTIDDCEYTYCVDNNHDINLANGIIDYRPIISTNGSSCVFQTIVPSTNTGGSTSSSIFPFSNVLIILFLFFSVFLLN